MDYKHLHKVFVNRLLEGEGTVSNARRLAAFDNAIIDEPLKGLLAKVAYHPYKITDEDIAAAKKSGLSEDQIFELVICAAVGQATRQYDSALKALDEVVGSQRGHMHAS